ncbi:MAG: 30S ribosomal protein S13 [candidate division CPR1 bacterium GW2011_GWC1_49_13]|uniref:Small ribosomal subunit protein uS13 n=1 Tax=candidate division CPR1 bacterium GW2011_GWC1_49_13 TaxID=1618342 RepID=A0A0G1VIE0_9BACT|nr:MAG: 30S ribosomal protein S13 [candidate division CPR1 bacterium GW2011_GWC1_49_13]
MARIAGVEIPNEKKIVVALTYVRGIGPNLSQSLLKELGISPDLRTSQLTEEQVGKIRDFIAKKGIRVEGELTSSIIQNIKRLKEIGSYRGLRHERNLPARGQKTRTNARTRRGRKATVSGTSKSSMEAKKAQKT